MSSVEAELYTATRVSEAKGKSRGQDFSARMVAFARMWTLICAHVDAQASGPVVSGIWAGLGKAMPIETAELTIQDAFGCQERQLVKVGGAHNLVDMITKPV